MLISIIIPVYNAEKTIRNSLESLSRQEGDFEVVFVNDGSTDRTEDVIRSFMEDSHLNGRILHQENAGVAAARNTGLDAAEGDYLMFLDADDSLADDALKLVSADLVDGPDILGWDWVNDENGKIRQMRQASYGTAQEALTALMGGTMKWNLWLFAVRRERMIANGIRFIPGEDMGEDMQFMLKAFSCARTVKQTHQVIYRYNASNPASISAHMNERRRSEVSANLASAVEYLQQSDYRQLCGSHLPHLQLYIKRPLLISSSREDYETWYRWFPESNAFATKNKSLPFHTRLMQGWAAKRLWLLLKIYNLLMYKILYPLIR